MTSFVRSTVGLAGTFAVIATLLTGCGAKGLPTGAARTMAAAGAKGHVAWAQPNVARPKVRSMQAAVAHAQAMEDDAGDDPKPAPAPTAAPAGGGDDGGMKPLPKPTAIPAPKGGGGAGRPADDVDNLLYQLSMYGYEGDRKHMIKTLQASIYAFPADRPETPGGWEKKEYDRRIEHFNWWKSTFISGETLNLDDYMKQSLYVAQNRFNVRYYIWVSKQQDPETMQKTNQRSPWVNFNEELPVVKAIGNAGWMVNISAKGEIQDYLRMSEEFIYPTPDFNHVLPIPQGLYF
ncbi:MAG: hypothetical protein JWM80_5493 [Cyanobacteria bacterium RYN_339]|nr:hypothetical protein [Cyanobacteria bacterium RYN_339]